MVIGFAQIKEKYTVSPQFYFRAFNLPCFELNAHTPLAAEQQRLQLRARSIPGNSALEFPQLAQYSG